MHSSTDYLWLRRDTFFTDTGSGLQLSNSSTGFEVTGASAYRMFRTVYPFLDGSYSLGALRQATGDHWSLIERFLAPLTDHGFLRWVPESDFEALDKEQRGRNADQIAYLAQFIDTPHAAFQRFASARILVVGESPLANSLAVNLVDNGAGQVTATSDWGRQSIAVEPDAAGGAQHFDLVVLDPDSLHLRHEFEERDVLAVVVHGGELRALTRPWRAADGLTWRDAAVALGSESLLDPQGVDGGAPEEGTLAAGERVRAEPIQRMFGALLSYEIFKGLTGAIEPETASRILVLDGVTGETRVHRVAPAPVWGGPRHVEIPVPRSVSLDVEDSRAEEYDLGWAQLVDPITLPASEFVDLEFEQVPVRVTELLTDGLAVRAASLWTTADARIEALSRCYEEYFAARLPLADHHVGVDVDAARATGRAIRAAACAAALAGGAKVGRNTDLGSGAPAVDFIHATAPDLSYMDLGSYSGWHVGLVHEPGRWAVAAEADLSGALIAAATEVLAARQTGVEVGVGDPGRFLGDETPVGMAFEAQELPNDLAAALGLTVVAARTVNTC